MKKIMFLLYLFLSFGIAGQLDNMDIQEQAASELESIIFQAPISIDCATDYECYQLTGINY